MRDEHGTMMVEALVACVLLAGAAAVVVAAATASLRAVRRATVTERATALAARELALLQATPLTEGTTSEQHDAPGFAAAIGRATTVDAERGIAALAVTISAGPPPLAVRLTTDRWMPE